MAPDDSSTPLQTMSYWIALMERILSWSAGVEREEFLDAQVRHRERVMREVDFLLLLVPFVHREIDDPAELEAVLGDQAEFLADLGARGAGEFDEILRLAGDEEAGVADAELELIGDLLGALRPDVLGERAGAALLAFAPEDVAEAGLALALRPGIHAVAEGAVAALRRRNRPHRAFGSLARMLAKILKPEPRKASLTSCITIGLRRSGLSVPYFAAPRHKG